MQLERLSSEMLSDELALNISRMSQQDALMTFTSWQLANVAHQGQTRFAGKSIPRVPYIGHPMRVALRLSRWGCDDLIAPALLHDAVEDGTTKLLRIFDRAEVDRSDHEQKNAVAAELIKILSYDIVYAVLSLTHDSTEDYLRYISRIQADRNLSLIKASDLLDNAGSLQEQHGEMTNARLKKLTAKYLPATRLILNGLEQFDQADSSAEKARVELRNMLTDLEKLRDALDLEI